MRVEVLLLCRQLLPLQISLRFFASACAVLEKDATWVMTPLNQFSRSDFSSSLANLISSAELVTGMLPSGTLSLETLSGSVTGCDANCVTTLTAYTDAKQGTVVMLRPSDVSSFGSYSAMKVDSILCALSQGYCGADVPLYLYYSQNSQDYFVGLESDTYSDYSALYSGKPLCYVWAISRDTSTSGDSTTTSGTWNTDLTTLILDFTAAATTTTTTTATTTASLFMIINATVPSSNVSTTTATSSSNATITTSSGNTVTVAASTVDTVVSTKSTPVYISTSTVANSTSAIGRKSSNLWPLLLAGIAGLGVLIITTLAVTTLKIIRSGKRGVLPQNSSCSPPPPYPYAHDATTELPPAPVSAMFTPQPFTINSTMNAPFAPS